MRTKVFQKSLAAILAAAVCFSCLDGTVMAEEAAKTTEEPTRVSVHDPSVILADGTWYLFGSHLADAKSEDLIHWTQMNNDWNNRATDAWKQDSVYGAVLENLAESFAWAGYDDGDCSGGNLAVWAPDVIYNPGYLWEDGTKGAYMLYYSASSTWRRSCIGYAVSKNVEGPYQYVDTIIYSGFTKTGKTDGRSTRNTKWDNSYLNLSELIAEGTIAEVSDNWFTADGSWNENYAPNAIDPTLFFSKEGELYMVYGSWSGGLYILEVDAATGEPKYPGTDGTESISKNRVDRYFGTHIAGGNHQSGEGSYILYDEESDYYYLYETYGGLLSDGGYNMRLFRSKNVYGPYTDAAGRSAENSGEGNEDYGIKLIGNYQFKDQPGYRSAGHNSAWIDEEGEHYLFYHQRFDQPEHQTEAHQVRVRQQFLNEDDWPVPAVYEYRGEKIEHYKEEEIAGSYEIINHGTATSGDMIHARNIKLNSDGTVSGAMRGNWKKTTASGKNYDYITITVGGAVYKGVFYKQMNEEENAKEVMTFSVIGSNNTCIWGTQTALEKTPDSSKEEESSEQVPGSPTEQEGTDKTQGDADKTQEGTDRQPVSSGKKKSQEITGTSSYLKTYGAKAFYLDAKQTAGDGVLTYSSDQTKVASVNSQGKVIIKGTGIAVITITAGETADFEKQTKTVTIQVAPKKVKITSTKRKTSKTVILRWSKASMASGYQIQYSTNRKLKSAKNITVGNVKTTKKTIKKLKKGTTYYFRIRPYKKAGRTKIYGAYSAVTKVKVH